MSAPQSAKPANRLQKIAPSATVAIANEVRKLKESGQNVISFSIGVPNFLPPEHVYQAANQAVTEDSGNYLPGRGTPQLIQAFIKRLAEDSLHYEEAEICAAVGGKNGLFNLLQVLTEEGDTVLYPAPYWTSYPDIAALAGATGQAIETTVEEDYKLTAPKLRYALENTPSAKVFIFNTPSNPTGMLYSKEEVSALAEVLKDFPQIWILSDDIYDKLVYDGQSFTHLLHVAPELRSRTCIVQSVSKTYGMPGWRVGMVACPTPIANLLVKLVGQSVMNLNNISMAAAAAAFGGDHTFLTPIKEDLTAKRDLTLQMLKELNLPCPKPEGAFYAFPDISSTFGKTSKGGTKIEDDQSFCSALLKEHLVALVPGSAFGAPYAARISYACKKEDLQQGLSEIQKFITSLV